MKSASLIITSYNQSHVLNLTLESLRQQTVKDFEVIVADDGSSDNTRKLCEQNFSYPLRFVTQPDMGYRKAKILNKALHQAQSDYLIFIDADVILEKHFIEDHLDLKRPNHFVCGRRVELGPEFSKTLTLEKVRDGQFNQFNFDLLKSVVKKDSEHFNRSLRIKNPLLRKIFKYDKPMDILGCNFSAWRKDIEAVNGFNEALEAYWGEDGDIFIRLRNTGKFSVGAKALCVQFHVFHERRVADPANQKRYYDLLKTTDYKWAKMGLNQGDVLNKV